MSAKRPGAGVRVSGGKLRVDTARAVEKLRSHQLADPLAWVLEVVRAGTLLAGVEHIAVEGSGGDVFVAITSEPVDAERLPRLFEELVDPSSLPDARALRLLAMGVNAALGRDDGATRHVDVFTIGEKGAMRVRFTPRIFAVEEETGVAKALRTLSAEPVAPPTHAPRIARGVLVHARSVMGLGALTRWAVGEEPRELPMVRDAARELTIPLTVQGLPVAADPSILLREPIEGGGYVALVSPRTARHAATLEAAEMGIVLSREPWACGIGDGGAVVPLLARIDRERWPTNAARSAVRWDEPMAAGALDAARAALTTLIVRLADAMKEGQTGDARRLSPRGSWLREAALSLLAAEARGVTFRTRLGAATIAPVLHPLLDAPLLFDAVGRMRTPRSLAVGRETSVHLDPTFADAALAPWIGDVLAAPPGDPTHLLFGDLPPASASMIVAAASEQRVQAERWRARPVLAPTLEGERALVRVRLSTRLARGTAKQTALTGEVALGTEGTEREMALRIGGRAIETRRRAIGVGVRIVADSEALTPTPTYDAVQDDDACRAVLEAIAAAVLAGTDALARAMLGEPVRDATVEIAPGAAADPRAAALIRHAIVEHAMQAPERAAKRLLGTPLGRAAVWPTASGSAISLDAIAKADAIGWLEPSPKPAGPLPRARPVLLVSDAERTALHALFPRASFVSYAPARAPSRPLIARSLTLAGKTRVALREKTDDYERVAAWSGRETGIETFHAGVRLGYQSTRATPVPTVIVVDDDRFVPDERWTQTRIDTVALEHEHDPRAASGRIARAIVRRWLGEDVPELTHEVPLDDEGLVRDVMRVAEPSEAERQRLRTLPLWPGLHGGRIDAEALLRAGEGRVPFVPPESAGRLELDEVALDALRATADEARGLARLLGVPEVVDLTEHVRAAIAQAARGRRLAALRGGRVRSLELDHDDGAVRVLGTGLEGTLAFRAGEARRRITLLFERHALTEIEDASFPPHLAAVVSVDETLLDDAGLGLSAAGLTRVRGALQASARELVVTRVRARPAALFAEPALGALVDHLALGTKRRGPIGTMLDALAEVATLPSMTGPPVTIRAAIADDALGYVTEVVPVTPPVDEPPTALDRLLPLVAWEQGDDRFARLARVAGVPLRDQTVEVRALFAARRARLGWTAKPTLRAGHEPGLSRSIEALIEGHDDAAALQAALGFGMLGLIEGTSARVRFFEAGEVAHEITLALAPAFEAAIESPLVGARRLPTSTTRAAVESALTTVLARLLRVLADEGAFDTAPTWAIDAQREAALLGGATHLARLGGLRLFATTTGARVSYDAIVRQRDRFGAVWWTAPSSSSVPLDPERFALRLTPAHAAALARAVPVVDATEELRLDAIAAANQARPPIAAIDLDDTERAAAIAVDVERDPDGHVSVVAPLWPRFAAMSTLALFRGLHPLGEQAPPGEIPILAKVGSPHLVPNRTWSGALRNETVLAIERSVLRRAETSLMHAIPVPRGSMPSVTLDHAWLQQVPQGKKRAIRGRLTLGAIELEGGERGVQIVDASASGLEDAAVHPLEVTVGERDPAPLPLEGILLVWDDDALPALENVARHAYLQLLDRIAGRVAAGRSPDADLDRAHLVHAAGLGLVRRKEVRDVELPFGRGPLRWLHGLVTVLAGSSTVIALAPGEDDAHEAFAGRPLFVDDGSLAASRLVLTLGPRAITRTDALALALGIRQAEPEPKKQVTTATDAAPAKKKRGKTEPAPAKKMPPTSGGPVEPLAARAQATLREIDADLRISVARRAVPLVRTERTDISLAGESALLSQVAGSNVHRERAARLIAAHATLLRQDSLRALQRLLER